MSAPIKPEVCIINDRLAVFMGADYKLMPLEVADPYVRRMQGLVAEMKREQKRAKRKARAV